MGGVFVNNKDRIDILTQKAVTPFVNLALLSQTANNGSTNIRYRPFCSLIGDIFVPILISTTDFGGINSSLNPPNLIIPSSTDDDEVEDDSSLVSEVEVSAVLVESG